MENLAFWIFMLIFGLLVPAVMIIFGRMFLKAAPKEINRAFGYRTNRSMKNRDTWEFAHKCIGKLWRDIGYALILPSVICMLFALGRDVDSIGYIGLVLEAVQLIALLVPIFLVEAKLKKNFDEYGRRIK